MSIFSLLLKIGLLSIILVNAFFMNEFLIFFFQRFVSAVSGGDTTYTVWKDVWWAEMKQASYRYQSTGFLFFFSDAQI